MPYKTKTVGRYNVNYLGLKKDSIGNLYELVEIIKFNKDDKPVRNTHLYFRSNNLWEHEFVQPDLDTEEELAKYSSVPVWNGLTNEFHPTQMLADFMTMEEEYENAIK